ncbi:porin family protein [Rhodobacteraceae bacterium M385]|nr:porin family protein [Rhodobacteraceae bacterium M385]
MGVGYERMLDANWGIRAEVNHRIYEDDYTIYLLPPNPEQTRADFQNKSVQIGVTYHF